MKSIFQKQMNELLERVKNEESLFVDKRTLNFQCPFKNLIGVEGDCDKCPFNYEHFYPINHLENEADTYNNCHAFKAFCIEKKINPENYPTPEDVVLCNLKEEKEFWLDWLNFFKDEGYVSCLDDLDYYDYNIELYGEENYSPFYWVFKSEKEAGVDLKEVLKKLKKS